MEFENQVADELTKKGYYIFYKNVEIKDRHNRFIEFDIVCSEFILEIKSGKSLKAKGIYNLMYQNILPNNDRLSL